MSNYQGISLPINLLKLIEEKVSEKGYSSRTDFIKQAIREKIERMERVN